MTYRGRADRLRLLRAQPHARLGRRRGRGDRRGLRPRPRQGRGLRARLRRGEAFTDAAAMLAAVRPDFVDVATTVESHRPLVELALRARRADGLPEAVRGDATPTGCAMVEAAERGGAAADRARELPLADAVPACCGRELDRGRDRAARTSRGSRSAMAIRPLRQPALSGGGRGFRADGRGAAPVRRGAVPDGGRGAARPARRSGCNPAVRGEDAFAALLRHDERRGVERGVLVLLARSSPSRFRRRWSGSRASEGTLELTFDYRMRLHRDGRGRGDRRASPRCRPGARGPGTRCRTSVAAFEAHVVDGARGAGRAAAVGRGTTSARWR